MCQNLFFNLCSSCFKPLYTFSSKCFFKPLTVYSRWRRRPSGSLRHDPLPLENLPSLDRAWWYTWQYKRRNRDVHHLDSETVKMGCGVWDSCNEWSSDGQEGEVCLEWAEGRRWCLGESNDVSKVWHLTGEVGTQVPKTERATWSMLWTVGVRDEAGLWGAGIVVLYSM